MWKYFSKVLSGFCYGAGFLLAVFCATYVVNQHSKDGVQLAGRAGPDRNPRGALLEDIEIKNVSKLSNFLTYADDGRREEFIFTGELVNRSGENNYKKLMVEIDLFDSDGKFISKCGGWDGVRLELDINSALNFQRTCYQMPSQIVKEYDSHKAVVRQRKI